MRGRGIPILIMASVILSCNQPEERWDNIDDLTGLKKQFIDTISVAELAEGPFSFNYEIRTVFHSENVISLFATLSVQDRLPHGWKRYEGKTFYKINGQWKEVQLDDLFVTDQQKKFLRAACEKSLKNDPISYFSGNDVLRTRLEQTDLHTFVIDHDHLIVIFQPYIVGSGADGPFVVTIPLTELDTQWESTHPLCQLLDRTIKSHDFISSWDVEEYFWRLENEDI